VARHRKEGWRVLQLHRRPWLPAGSRRAPVPATDTPAAGGRGHGHDRCSSPARAGP